MDVFDLTATQGFFIGTDNSQLGQLILRTVTNPGTTPVISGNIFIPVLATAEPLLVPHLGNNNGTAGYLSAVDERLTSTHVRNNFLYTCHNIGVNNQGVSGLGVVATRNGSRWYQIDIPHLAPLFCLLPERFIQVQQQMTISKDTSGCLA